MATTPVAANNPSRIKVVTPCPLTHLQVFSMLTAKWWGREVSHGAGGC